MLHRLGLAEMAAQVQGRRISARELVRAHLDQIEKVNPRINAFVSVLAEQATAAAEAPLAGPLQGVPVTVKDSFDMAGQPTLCGSRFRVDHRAAADATVVARLTQAGAIILGKTNTPEFLAHYETDNHIIGRTNNPWNPDRTAGGSSGGEAAAIAAFCSAGGIGSDGGGSIRWPAHCTGICGLKPTPGRVPATGHFPLIHHPGGLLGVAGPMARSILDLRLLFDVLAGYDPADPFSAPVAHPWPDVGGIRIGLWEQFYEVPVQPALRDAVREAARLLRRAGFPVAVFEPKGLERAPNLWSFFFSELNVPFQRDLFQGRETEAHWTGTEFYEVLKDKPEPTGKQVVENLAARDAMRRSLLEQMHETPVLLTPASGVTAFAHRQRRFATESKPIGLFQAMMPLTWVNLLGLPAIVLPFTLDAERMPVGIQLVGRPWEEEVLLELAIRLDQFREPLPELPLTS
jgi:Asp-tRNA(Asn)/Glu-tRNA(Gln) amidotransferase A subunit family amidase